VTAVSAMRFVQVDVFGDEPYQGNPLAVFPDAAGLTGDQMQTIAREMNLSETSFVMSAEGESYDVRIFTPAEELPFAGHPTLGTAWVLRHSGMVKGERLTQHSPAGATSVSFSGDRVSFERTGSVEPDLDQRSVDIAEQLARALSLKPTDIGHGAGALGRAGTLRPARADAGVAQLMVPVRDLETLGRVSVRRDLLDPLDPFGVYCFTGVAPGTVRARGLFPGAGVPEDPATGSAAAGLGLYLAARLGEITFEIEQGAEIGRPSRLYVAASPGHVQVGGRCHLVFEGEMSALPAS
jgi:trans-2,3-dihydro-3-hydroxyanthranilate isomerase